ncbi:MAG: hypothetical protein C0456_14330 [Hyphomonas sp.]|uniref:hypothetical protein n=1 Tax=Hyphomonas sp. TaxID=87 RepID=UPI001D66E888|nr:hypothetical protein [Hyphomonas sp.]MBA4227801.1 hypothetical protein [Hyphomonas sp.]
MKPNESSFDRCFGHRANTFVRCGLIHFGFWLAILGLYCWRIIQLAANGRDELEFSNVWELSVGIVASGLIASYAASAITFLRSVFRVRKFLSVEGGLTFQSWAITLFAFVMPIVNFFAPWNRLDRIRETLEHRVDTGEFSIVRPANNQLRGIGIAWGLSSMLVLNIEPQKLIVHILLFIAYCLLVALQFWMFMTAARWLSTLLLDFDRVRETGQLSNLTPPSASQPGVP